MTACPTCGIEPTCTCKVFTPTPGPCRVHAGIRPFKDPIYFGTTPRPTRSINLALFEHFTSQPDSRSRELQ